MNIIDRSFYGLAAEIRALGEKELYYRIRRGFDAVQAETQRSCADFFNRFGYWGRLEPERGIYDEIELKDDDDDDYIPGMKDEYRADDSEIEDAGFSIENVPEDDLELGSLDDDDDGDDDDSFPGFSGDELGMEEE